MTASYFYRRVLSAMMMILCIAESCRYRGTTRTHNQKWIEGNYQMQCTITGRSYRVAPIACATPSGTILRSGTSVEESGKKYECLDRGNGRLGFRTFTASNADCRRHGRTRTFGSTWIEKEVYELKCVSNGRSSIINCRTPNGVRVPLNTTVTDGNFKVTCTADGNGNVNYKRVAADDADCVDSKTKQKHKFGDSWRSGFYWMYTCAEQGQTKLKHCFSNRGTPVPLNSSITEGRYTIACTSKGNSFERTVEAADFGDCFHNGRTYAYNDTWDDAYFRMRCAGKSQRVIDGCLATDTGKLHKGNTYFAEHFGAVRHCRQSGNSWTLRTVGCLNASNPDFSKVISNGRSFFVSDVAQMRCEPIGVLPYRCLASQNGRKRWLTIGSWLQSNGELQQCHTDDQRRPVLYSHVNNDRKCDGEGDRKFGTVYEGAFTTKAGVVVRCDPTLRRLVPTGCDDNRRRQTVPAGTALQRSKYWYRCTRKTDGNLQMVPIGCADNTGGLVSWNERFVHRTDHGMLARQCLPPRKNMQSAVSTQSRNTAAPTRIEATRFGFRAPGRTQSPSKAQATDEQRQERPRRAKPEPFVPQDPSLPTVPAQASVPDEIEEPTVQTDGCMYGNKVVAPNEVITEGNQAKRCDKNKGLVLKTCVIRDQSLSETAFGQFAGATWCCYSGCRCHFTGCSAGGGRRSLPDIYLDAHDRQINQHIIESIAAVCPSKPGFECEGVTCADVDGCKKDEDGECRPITEKSVIDGVVTAERNSYRSDAKGRALAQSHGQVFCRDDNNDVVGIHTVVCQSGLWKYNGQAVQSDFCRIQAAIEKSKEDKKDCLFDGIDCVVGKALYLFPPVGLSYDAVGVGLAFAGQPNFPKLLWETRDRRKRSSNSWLDKATALKQKASNSMKSKWQTMKTQAGRLKSGAVQKFNQVATAANKAAARASAEVESLSDNVKTKLGKIKAGAARKMRAIGTKYNKYMASNPLSKEKKLLSGLGLGASMFNAAKMMMKGEFEDAADELFGGVLTAAPDADGIINRLNKLGDLVKDSYKTTRRLVSGAGKALAKVAKKLGCPAAVACQCIKGFTPKSCLQWIGLGRRSIRSKPDVNLADIGLAADVVTTNLLKTVANNTAMLSLFDYIWPMLYDCMDATLDSVSDSAPGHRLAECLKFRLTAIAENYDGRRMRTIYTEATADGQLERAFDAYDSDMRDLDKQAETIGLASAKRAQAAHYQALQEMIGSIDFVVDELANDTESGLHMIGVLPLYAPEIYAENGFTVQIGMFDDLHPACELVLVTSNDEENPKPKVSRLKEEQAILLMDTMDEDREYILLYDCTNKG